MSRSVLNIAIIGTGKIGCDLLVKVLKEPNFRLSGFIGRKKNSDGIKFAEDLSVKTYTDGIMSLDKINDLDIIFDATNSEEHIKNMPNLNKKRARIINLTPALMQFKCIPAINLQEVEKNNHISLVTCGGQAAIPIIYAISKSGIKVEYVEVVTSIASNSAGQGTRKNISDYQAITEEAIAQFSGILKSKSILVINPAIPPVTMQTTIYVAGKNKQLNNITNIVRAIVGEIKNYIPGYELIADPVQYTGYVVIMIKVVGSGDYLPSYAGNLDIITSAAIKVAKFISMNKMLRNT